MKTLVLDQGNSTLLAGVFRGDQLMRLVRITASNPAQQLRKLARGKVDRVALCSVVPSRTAGLAARVKRMSGLDPQILTVTSDHGLKLAYYRSAELGTDRLASALGAQKLHPRKHLIVVDCGTATTITLLSRDGTLLGGAILPGLGLWAGMLAQRTARLPEVTLQWPAQVVGRDTTSALRSGILHGHAGAIRELVAQSRAEAFGRAPVVVIGTGGLVTHFEGQSLFTTTEPALILHGLQAFASRNLSHA